MKEKAEAEVRIQKERNEQLKKRAQDQALKQAKLEEIRLAETQRKEAER